MDGWGQACTRVSWSGEKGAHQIQEYTSDPFLRQRRSMIDLNRHEPAREVRNQGWPHVLRPRIQQGKPRV